MRRPTQILLLALAATAAALAMAGTASAAASPPCWQVLIDDWYDGRIDSIYSVQCYRDALEHMPEDVAQYSSLEDDLNRALAAAIASQGDGGGGAGGGQTGGGTGGSGANGGGTTKTASTFYGGPRATLGRAVIGDVDGRTSDGGPVGAAISSLGPDSADSVPVPLIVLGALAMALLTLGTVGIVARRAQTRRAAVRQGAKG